LLSASRYPFEHAALASPLLATHGRVCWRLQGQHILMPFWRQSFKTE